MPKTSLLGRRRTRPDEAFGQYRESGSCTHFGLSAVGEPGEVSWHRTNAVWYWVGAHGGAGVTTLGSAVGAGLDASTAYPEPAGPVALPVVVVARSHAYGLLEAQHLAARAGTQGLTVLQRSARIVGLALIADAPGRLPKPLTELCHLVAGGYARVWDVPWVEAWRLGDTPTLANTPKQVGRMAREICVIVAKPKMDQSADTLERELGRTQSQR